MQKVRTYVVVLLVLAGLAAISSVVNSRYGTAQGAGAAPVTIASPLPVPVSGTVAATQGGAWNVGVPGGVSVSGTVTANQATGTLWNVGVPYGVSVSNPFDSAVWIRDSAARNNYQRTLQLDFAAGTNHRVLTAVGLGLGKLLVIENVSAWVEVPTGQKASVSIYTESPVYYYYPALASQGVFGTHERLVASQLMRAYADLAWSADVWRNDTTGSATAIVTIAGYLVDKP